YSLQTILEEFSMEPAVFTRGKFEFVAPMSGDRPHAFPKPVGIRKPMYTLHSEVATIPLSFREKGIQEASFKIAFDGEFLARVKFLRDLGLASSKPVDVSGSFVRPIELINKIAMSQKPGRRVGKMKQYEIVRTIVKGKQGKVKRTLVLDCHCRGLA